MATQEDFRVEDAGGIFRVTCKKDNAVLNISTATIKKIIFEKKGGDILIVDGEYPIGGDGTDGIMQHKFVPFQISVEGDWKAQAFVYFSSTDYYFSTQVTIKIGKNLATLAQVIVE
jgi:hypothetical protein